MIYWIYFQYKYPIVYYLLLDFMILIKNYVLKQDKSKSIIFSRKNFTFYCCSWDIYTLQLFSSPFQLSNVVAFILVLLLIHDGGKKKLEHALLAIEEKRIPSSHIYIFFLLFLQAICSFYFLQ